MVPAKGLDRAIEALAQIKNKVDFHLYMGGGAEKNMSNEEIETEAEIKALIKKHKMEKMVTMIGDVSHDKLLPAYYRNSDVFLLASRYEPFGLTTLEAMASGVTPIVSSVAGSKEIVVDGLNGFIIDTHDRKSLARLIQKVLTDQKLRKKIEENAAFTIKEHYSWDKIVEKFITLYKSLL
jgi:mannosylfructose-phosphate synthase